MKAAIHAIRGMNDILPDEAERWEWLEEILRAWLRSYGYRNIRTPILENTGLFLRAIGEATDIVEKEMYSFEDALNGERLSLRPEATASTVRAAIEHNLTYSGPQRLYYLGPMYRHERPQKGRYRQFHQIGAEALGFSGPDIDAEQLLMCESLWNKLNLNGLKLHLNSLGSSQERLIYRKALVGYFEAHISDLDEDSRRRLNLNPLRILDSKNPDMQNLIAEVPQLFDYMGEESLKHFDGVRSVLNDAGVSYQVNPRLVRGLDYYNLTVFEWVTDRLGAQGTVCGGGRYDGLFEQIGGKSIPAFGWAMGIERLLALLESQQIDIKRNVPDIYLVNKGEGAVRYAFRISEILRAHGISVIQHCGGGSFKSQMKKADSSGAPLAVIVGDEEIATGIVTVKALRENKEQFKISVDGLSNVISEYLRRDPISISEGGHS